MNRCDKATPALITLADSKIDNRLLKQIHSNKKHDTMIQFRLLSNYSSELDAQIKDWQIKNPVRPETEKKEELSVLRKIPASLLPFQLKKGRNKPIPKSSH